MVEAATNAQIKEIFERNERTVRSDRRKKTVGKAELWVTELDALLERIRTAEADKARLSEALRAIVARSHNDPLGASKVNDMRNIATAALSGSGSGCRTTDRETEVLFFASYCGDDNPACSPARPCPVCLGMSNVYRIPAGTPIDYDRQLEPDWLINKHLEKLTARQIGKAPAAPQQGGE